MKFAFAIQLKTAICQMVEELRSDGHKVVSESEPVSSRVFISTRFIIQLHTINVFFFKQTYFFIFELYTLYTTI